MSYPSPGPSGAPQPAAGSAYSPGGPYPQPNVLGNHPVPGQRRNRGVLIGIVIAVVFAIAGLVIFGIVAKSTGAGGFTWGLVFAFVPVIPVIALYLWLDRYEPEPTKYIVVALCWGAFIATLVAIFINTEVSHRLAETGVGGDRSAVFVAPPVEEFAKGSIILLLALIRRKEFDGIIDGLVYAGMVGVGFAFTENILYYGRVFNTLSEEAGSDAGLRGAFALFIIRGVISPFAHPLFTSFIAIGIGVAIRHRSTVVRYLAPVVGYLAAVLAHAAWNASASWAGGGGFILAYLCLMVPLFICLVVFALVMRSREGQMIASRLYDYVRFGWLVPQDVPLIATLRGRKALRQNARRYGPQAEAAAKAFQHNATELAYLRDKIVRQVIGPEALETEKRLLDELRERRPSVPFPPMPAFAQAAPYAGVPMGPGAPMGSGAPMGPGSPGVPGAAGVPGAPMGPGGPLGPGAPGAPVGPGVPMGAAGQGGPMPGGPGTDGPGAGGPGAGGPGAGGPGAGGPGPVGPGGPDGSVPGGAGQTPYPRPQDGYPPAQSGYPSGPPGQQGPPGGYGPYPPQQ
ncbi:PrsW family intramembrane metalloprotease [Kribbella shirazensis]|uniref:RsiW-degrading membrane proteinase PrsW (M82 family) n=1 Tax=Kribbella shirazensis TaxID=1105143 RepID=A0A7X5VHA5_9ACTN|nr:PrsW family intramembrane metalloprotease [Kribbella shirazensis]NIK61241.1 RsiW-degrading membrane proteinase PrsW (M82 family) [Kribbella shirazensis]